MATTKDNNPGLLSKVAKFVRNPTRDWSELEQEDSQPDSGYTKQALKEMIERKRQNDFVRKREFDQLRKLRNRDPNRSADPGRPSFFQSSLPSNPDERAMTLKKIDEIEAQMSKQWWKGKQEGAAGTAGSFPVAANPTSGSDDPTLPGVGSVESMRNYAPTEVASIQARDAANDVDEFAATRTGHSVPPGFVVSDPVMAPRRTRSYGGDPRPQLDPPRSGAAGNTPAVYAVDLGQMVADPDLEDAAIRFANGDDAGAEEGLVSALRGADVTPKSAALWMSALFDLYRATGRQERFDAMAIEFAQTLGQSAPTWFSMPEMLGLGAADGPGKNNVERPVGEPIWTSPPELGLTDLRQLGKSVASAPSPWHIDWSRLVSVQPEAIDALEQLLSDWCRQKVKLFFSGPASLDDTLRNLTPSGDRSVNPACWRLRLDALRIMRLQDEFELVALDYCVTYEVSPPSWREATCEYLSDQAAAYRGSAVIDPMVDDDTLPNAQRSRTLPMQMDSAPAPLAELVGVVAGDASDALAKLDQALQGGNRLVVSCAKLVRVDFAAAGSILNWVASRQSDGCHVQFRDVHRLVAVFFNVIGITEHAKVIARTH